MEQFVCGLVGDCKIGEIYSHPLYGRIKVIEWYGAIIHNGRVDNNILAEAQNKVDLRKLLKEE